MDNAVSIDNFIVRISQAVLRADYGSLRNVRRERERDMH